MLYEILKHIRNFFPDVAKQKEAEFEISNNVIRPSFDLLSGQYFLIEGSALNDGIHRAGEDLENEIFRGVITPLKIPKDLLSLATEIEDFESKNKPSAFSSESFGGYSYTRATNSAGKQVSWQDAYSTRLNAWRKL